MMRHVLIASQLAAAVVFAAGPTFAASTTFGGSDNQTVLKVSVPNSEYGHFLTDAQGRSLYAFSGDIRGVGGDEPRSQCFEACTSAWPPFKAQGKLEAGKGIDPSLIGSFLRKDGTRQVTYNGWPLYHSQLDELAGNTRGQGRPDYQKTAMGLHPLISGYHSEGEWHLVTPKGGLVHSDR